MKMMNFIGSSESLSASSGKSVSRSLGISTMRSPSALNALATALTVELLPVPISPKSRQLLQLLPSRNAFVLATTLSRWLS